MLSGKFDIAGSTGAVAGDVFWCEWPGEAGGAAGPEFGLADALAGRQQGACGEHAIGFDDAGVHDDAAQPDEAVGFEHAAVNEGHVADEDIVVDFGAVALAGYMDDAAILNVGAGANDDALDIAAQHAIILDRAFGTEDDIADDLGAGGDPGGFVDLGAGTGEGVVGHGRKIS